MEANSPISCLRKLFNQNIKKFLSAEAKLKDAISIWASNEQSTSLRMLLSDYQDYYKGILRGLMHYCKGKKYLLLQSAIP